MSNSITLWACCLLGCVFSSCQSSPDEKPVTSIRSDYREPHRPQLHFSPPANWMNDPNGMVYFDGEYHLFYQYYPDSTVWGPMHWGHAVSTDLLHWQHLPVALEPDSLGYIFSGSAVVDSANTSGLGRDGKVPLVAIYTYHRPEYAQAGRNDIESQGIAYSLDRGRTWVKYAGNPVLPNPGDQRDFRDPKVFWHAPSRSWIMVLAVGDHVAFYRSPNLLEWTRTGDFGKGQFGSHGGVWECPDLFPLRMDGNGPVKWVLLVSIGDGAVNGGSGTQYFVGQFDGKTFVSEQHPEIINWLDYGRDNYAGVTWSNAPDGRRILLGWMSNWKYAQTVPTHPWRSAMTLPRELQLVSTRGIPRLRTMPVSLDALHDSSAVAVQAATIADTLVLPWEGDLMDVDLAVECAAGRAPEWAVELFNDKGEVMRVGYEMLSGMWFTDRRRAGKSDFDPGFAGLHRGPRLRSGDTLRLRIVSDRSSVEVWADDGLTALTDLFFPSAPLTRWRLVSKGGTTRLFEARAQRLRGIWNPGP